MAPPVVSLTCNFRNNYQQSVTTKKYKDTTPVIILENIKDEQAFKCRNLCEHRCITS